MSEPHHDHAPARAGHAEERRHAHEGQPGEKRADDSGATESRAGEVHGFFSVGAGMTFMRLKEVASSTSSTMVSLRIRSL